MNPPAVFIDRDGTIVHEVPYLRLPESVRLVDGVVAALANFRQSGFRIIVVSNQGGIAKGLLSVADVEAVNNRFTQMLRQAGAPVDRVEWCGHHPQGSGEWGIACRRRKPAPGMILDAATALGIDLSHSWLVGNRTLDTEAGAAAKVRSIHLRLGQGAADDPASAIASLDNWHDIASFVRATDLAKR